jgi:hypothetical protein
MGRGFYIERFHKNNVPCFACGGTGMSSEQPKETVKATDWRSQLTDDERQLLADIQAADSPLGGSQLVKRLASLLDEITA